MYDEGLRPREVSFLMIPCVFRSSGSQLSASLGAAVMSTFFKSQLSTVHRVFYKLGRRMPYA